MFSAPAAVGVVAVVVVDWTGVTPAYASARLTTASSLSIRLASLESMYIDWLKDILIISKLIFKMEVR